MNVRVSGSTSENYRLQRYIVALSGVILLAKFVAWSMTESVAIFTDAMESIINVAAGIIGLYALYLSTKPRDFDHPYGHGRAEFLSAATEGSMITIAGVLILMEAVRNILNPSEIPNLEIGMLLILATAVINFLMGTAAVKKGKKNRSQALVASGRHLQSDSYSSVGIISGLVLLLVLTRMGYNVFWIDGAIAMVFGAIIISTGALVVKRSIDGIMDKIDIELLNGIVKTLSDNRRDAWVDIHDVKIVKYWPTIHIDMHVTMPWNMSVREQREEVNALISLLRGAHGESVDLSVSSDPCQDFACTICGHECDERKAEFIRQVKWDIESLTGDAQHGEVSDDRGH